ncbi:hypothetical protein TWF718_003113 [Orbilia javanica]|uniref:F-box domain-containing protein n=1 Tax=Orbilia javanica TaxID=47235 RepID=A0AAN8RBT6_9PEZI
MTSPQTTLTTLSPELLYSILNNVDNEDLYRLLFVCKYTYHAAHAELRSSLGCIKRWPTVKGSNGKCSCFGSRHVFRRLLSTGHDRTSLNEGNIRTVGICAQSLRDDTVRRALAEGIKSGRLRPRYFVLKFNHYGDSMRSFDEPWYSIREYCRSSQVSLLLSIRDYNIRSTLDFITGHTDKVTDLNISFTFGSPQFNSNPEALIKDLSTILTATPNLKTLELSFSDPDEEYRTWPIHERSNLLTDLQIAFNSLKRLQTLRIKGTFIHPSFFLKTPESVKTLELRCMTTPTWWLGFATYPFKNVENLVLYHETGESQWRDVESEKSHGLDINSPDFKFNINSVAISSLKKFSGRAPLFGPSDLLKCVLANNKGLGRKHKFRQNWGDEVLPAIDSCAMVMLDCLSETVTRNKKQYTRKYLQLHGESEEQCVREFMKKCLQDLGSQMTDMYSTNF